MYGIGFNKKSLLCMNNLLVGFWGFWGFDPHDYFEFWMSKRALLEPFSLHFRGSDSRPDRRSGFYSLSYVFFYLIPYNLCL